MKSKLLKLFGLTAIAAALFACFAISASAVDLNQLTYATNDDGTIAITGCDKEAEGELVIPETIGGRKVTAINYSAFENCKNISKVSLPSTLTVIGSDVFSGCTALKEVSIPYGVTEIGNRAFKNCTSLPSISIPDSVTNARIWTLEWSGVFSGCTSLANVKLSANMTRIGNSMFENCTSLKTISIPASVTLISDWAFHGSGLKEIVLPATVTDTDRWAFKDCFDLEKVTLSEGLTDIDAETFENCTSLKSIVIPDTATLDDSSFRGCTDLETVMIGKGATTILPRCFADCTNLRTVYLHSATTKLQDGVFSNCPALTDVYYCGTQAQWLATKIEEENDALLLADIHYIDSFNDVKTASWYGPAVLWAVGQNVTKGVGNNAFAPGMTCTNAQVITFLYRAAGSPAVSGTSPLNNVKNPNVYYYDPCLWACQKGILTDLNFQPDSPATRASFVTYLWRNKGKPVTTGKVNPFTDVMGIGETDAAILWAYENNITAGTSATTFSPDAICSRGQIVTFLYRYFG